MSTFTNRFDENYSLLPVLYLRRVGSFEPPLSVRFKSQFFCKQSRSGIENDLFCLSNWIMFCAGQLAFYFFDEA